MSINRVRMCKCKVSFTNLNAAKRVAEKHGQRVYECPVCFCFHCTSKDNWQDEFVPAYKYENIVRENERLLKIIRKYAGIKERKHNLEVENARLKRRIKQLEKFEVRSK